MRKFFRVLFSRAAFVAIFILMQIAAIVSMLTYFRDHFAAFYSILIFISVVAVVYILNQNGNPAYKIAWVIPIVLFPVFGVPMYLFFGKVRIPTNQRRRATPIEGRYEEAMTLAAFTTDGLRDRDPDAALQSAYLKNAAMAPVYTHTETEYFPLGDTMYPRMLEELRKARRFIFMEYFIIAPGQMWDTILAVLEEKARAGVDVRLIYDDMGCIMTLPHNYYRKLEAAGIRCRAFHRFMPVLNGALNNRDHRKICVVDGDVAFTGGINLADEYINVLRRFGHWLDCGVMLRGAAAYSFTAMFLSMWDYVAHASDSPRDFLPAPDVSRGTPTDGFVQPFTDTPMDNEEVGETAYINMISRAKRYVYICTPYLVIGSEMLGALGAAAKSGVDVRIITPGIPDKWYVHAVTRSYYAPLIRAGVRIFEYTPGFIHSKTFVCDDVYGICGTINLDFRSLYLHYECAVWMYESRAVTQMRDAFANTLAVCTEITAATSLGKNWIVRLMRSLLRVFAPLM